MKDKDKPTLVMPNTSHPFLCSCAHVTPAVLHNRENGHMICVQHKAEVTPLFFLEDKTSLHIVREGEGQTMCGVALHNMKLVFAQQLPECDGCADTLYLACCGC